MSYVWVYLYRSYIVMDPPTCGACCLEAIASQNFYTKREYCLCILMSGGRGRAMVFSYQSIPLGACA